MKSIKDFEVGDEVRICMTATRQKYNQIGYPGWVGGMGKLRGKTGEITYISDLNNTACVIRYSWKIEDLRLIKEKKTKKAPRNFKEGDEVRIICNQKTVTSIRDKKWIDNMFPDRIGKITNIYIKENIISVNRQHFRPEDLELLYNDEENTIQKQLSLFKRF